jgi:hypothetical protein
MRHGSALVMAIAKTALFLSSLALALLSPLASAREGKNMEIMTLHQLKAEFNSSKGKTRIISLLSPT